MAVVGGAMKGSGLLKNFNNIVIISADRNGSTSFQYNIFNPGLNNNDEEYLWLGEGFHSNSNKSQKIKYSPKEVVDTLNHGLHKSVILKSQITYPNFNNSFFDIPATRKIFLHRNLFDSTLSRCIAQTINRWHNTKDKDYDSLEISLDMFKDRLEYRIEKYLMYVDHIIDWANEFYVYDSITYNKDSFIKKNPNKKQKVKNYNQLYDLFLKYNQIKEIEKKVELLTKLKF